MRLKGKSLACASAAVLTLGLATGCATTTGTGGAGGAEAPTYNWDLQHTVGAASTWQEGAEAFADALEEKSDGRMTVNIFTNEQLAGGDSARAVEMVMNGETTFSYHSTIIYAGLDPRFGAISAPFLYEGYEEVDSVTHGSALEAYSGLTEEYGVKHLGFGENGFRQITNTVREIDEPEDLRGLKLRIPGITMFQDIYRELGANPMTMNFSEVFSAIQQGTIDGQENPVEVTNTSGLSEVLEYQTLWNYAYDPLILGMNLEAFEQLSEQDQQIVMEAAQEANALQIESNRSTEQAAIDEMSEHVETTELDASQLQAFRDATSGIYESYQDEWTADMVDAVSPEPSE